MKDTVKLFGRATKADWLKIRTLLQSKPQDKTLWLKTSNLMSQRIETRYFTSIKVLLELKTNNDEGFSVVALMCSLIEFYQSCNEGKYYEYNAKETKFVYGKSGSKFKTFLTTQPPFNSIFSKPVPSPSKYIINYADDFYTNVRCGLLHEASTKQSWAIKTAEKKCVSSFCDLTNDDHKIIYRDNLFEALKTFWNNVLNELLTATNEKKWAFCWKMDSLC